VLERPFDVRITCLEAVRGMRLRVRQSFTGHNKLLVNIYEYDGLPAKSFKSMRSGAPKDLVQLTGNGWTA
jgi:hypothetical protein